MAAKRMPLNLTINSNKLLPTPKIRSLKLIESEADVQDLYEKCIEKGYASIDFETTGLEWYKPGERLLSGAFSTGGFVSVFPIGTSWLRDICIRLLADESFTVIGHNWKFDAHWLGLKPEQWRANVIDTSVGLFLLDENKSVGLKNAVSRFFRVGLRDFKDFVGSVEYSKPDADTKRGFRKAHRIRTFDEAWERDEQSAVEYVANDAYYTEKLWFEIVKPNLARYPELERNFYEIQMPLLKVLWAMEERGVEVDVNKAKLLRRNYLRESNDVAAKIRSLLEQRGVLDEVNFGSPKQLDELLYGTLGLQRPPFRPKRKDEEGNRIESKYQTNELCLIWLATEKDSEVARLFLKHRKLTKLTGTFIDGILENQIHARLHTTFNQCVARTGRLSSSSPINLQNIPREKDIRSLFRARRGYKLVICDLSQAELRVLGHFSQDEVLLEAYRLGKDLHWDTAVDIGLSKLLNKADARYAGKTANFSMAYGVWADTFRFTLYKETEGRIKLSREEAIKVLKRLNDERYRGVSSWKVRQLQSGKEGIFYTLDKRRRRLPQIRDSNWARRSYAERQGINAIVQGSVGDIVNRIMAVSWYEWCIKYAIMQVHDEILLEIPDDKLAEFEVLLNETANQITQYYGLTIPVVIEYNISEVWSK